MGIRGFSSLLKTLHFSQPIQLEKQLIIDGNAFVYFLASQNWLSGQQYKELAKTVAAWAALLPIDSIFVFDGISMLS
jgi:hypothetical protein